MDSKLGLIIQLNGVFLITILSLFLRRSLKLTALKYWTTAWLCLSFALICLRLGFEYDIFGSLMFTYLIIFSANTCSAFSSSSGARVWRMTVSS